VHCALNEKSYPATGGTRTLMNTLGVIGGIGPESTIEYYRAILAAYRDQHGDAQNPPVLINSIDVKRLLGLVAAGDLAGLTAYLAAELRRLAAAGASLGMLAANTPHIVFDDVARHSPIPLVSIVEATCAEAVTRGLRRLGLFGTRFTMQGRFYADVFSKHGIDLIVPAAGEQDYIHDKYTTELLQNIFLPRTRQELLRIVENLKESDAIDGVILGGTELPLLLRDDTASGVPLLDTTKIHARAAVAQLWP
jgi:aspartate racemase